MLYIKGRSANSVAAELDDAYGDRSADMILRAMFAAFRGRIAVVSSFGADSSALLHAAAQVDTGVPVLFLETGKHFGATLRYREELAEQLGLTNVIDLKPDRTALKAADPAGALFASSPDACCAIRKVQPLQRALSGYDAWVTGRRRDQTFSRTGMRAIEADGSRLKVNPLAAWSKDDVDDYIAAHDLPRHPMVADGYPSIGCGPCTARPREGEDERSGRWSGLGKTECGIHLPAAAAASVLDR